MYMYMYKPEVHVHIRVHEHVHKMTLEEDKPGVLFLMGICPRRGVPYACMQRSEIADVIPTPSIEITPKLRVPAALSVKGA